MTPTPSEARQVALLPCPFCGGVPAIGPWKEAIDQSDTAPTAIECSSNLHDCPVNPSVARWTREEAIAAWNRRALRQGGEAWQPIATAPKDGRELLLATLNRRHPYIGKFSQYDLWCEPNGLIRAPTHWQPLPPPPAEGEAA